MANELSPEKERLFEYLDNHYRSLTYPRVDAQTEATSFCPDQVDLTTRFTRNIILKTPFVSSPMSTVTESSMAIAMAMNGGLGVIHMGLDPEHQAEEVIRVKKEVRNLVEEPETFQTTQTIEQVRNAVSENAWHFSSFPVLDENGKFAGLITEDGIERSRDPSSPVADQMKGPESVLTHSEDLTVQEAYDLMISDPQKRSRVVLIDEKNTVKGMYLFSDVKRVVVGRNRSFNVDSKGKLLTAAAIPTSDQALERLGLMAPYLDVAVFDTSDGDSPYAFKYYEVVKNEFPDIDIMSGNIISRKSARRIAEIGIDGIRTGQGGSPICTTRQELGTGLGQFTAVYRTARGVMDAINAHPGAVGADGRNAYDIPVCADGAIKQHGDPSKAIIALGETVMLGTGFAGVTETPGDLIPDGKGGYKKRHQGMGSAEEFDANKDAQARYESEGRKRPNPEGISTLVDVKGSLESVLTPYIEYLRKTMYQCNARTIDEHRMNTMFNPGDESTEREAASLQAM